MEDLKKEIIESALSEGILGQQDNIFFEKVEEIVDFEDWMVSEKMPMGLSFTLEANEWTPSNLVLQHHPEILQTGLHRIFHISHSNFGIYSSLLFT